MPATAICWSTYEFFKFALSKEKNEHYRSSVLTNDKNVSKIPEKNCDKSSNDQIMKSTHVRYVIPKPPVITTDIVADDSPNHRSSTTEPTIGGSQFTTSRELPSISGVGVYTAINMNPIHTERVFDPSIRNCSR